MIYHGLSFAEYLALPGWNWSLVKLMDKSARHVKHARDSDDDGDTASRGMLRAVHALVLEPDNFGAQFSVYEGKVRNGKLYDAHCACHPGTTVLNRREYDLAMETAWFIRTHPAVRRLLVRGDPEVSLTWIDEATQLPCKARIDWLTLGIFFDLKTLGTTEHRSVARMVAQNHYHGQLAHYDAGLQANGIGAIGRYLIVAEGKGAQDVAVYELDDGAPDGALHVGRQFRRRLMTRLAECVETDRWPGRHEEIQDLVLPYYALNDETETITFEEPKKAPPTKHEPWNDTISEW